MGSSDSSNAPIKIDVEDELEGESIGSTDYFFVPIGKAVPLKPNDSSFDIESLPSQPLVVSERFSLIFVAHSSGFFVARTKDVMDSAKEIEEKGSGCPIEQLSLVDVSVGKVHILALSTDNSMVAASVSGNILFFSVDNLLNKEVKQSFSCSLNDSSVVKDMRWITTSENSYVVLSNTGKLYYGEADFPLKDVIDDVDAVEWGVKGKFIAVARKNVLSILSTKFEEQVSISLSFRSWIGDSEVTYSVRVDSIKWIRPDSIIIGCFQLTGDGQEENYLLQVIKCRDGEITNACSELVVQSFCDIYEGLIDDIVPFGSGPYLLLSYLKQCQLAISANRKNTDQHIKLLSWLVDNDMSEAVVVDIERDKWVPRIELQENGDDNLVLGLCVDNISIYQKVVVQLGGEEGTELSPCCVLICLTLEGRLVLFHVARLAGNEISPEVTVLPDEEKDASLKLHAEERATILSGLQKQDMENVSLGHEFQDVKRNESILLGHNESSFKNDLQASEVSRNFKPKPFANPDQMPRKEDIAKTPEVELVANLKSLKPNGQKIVPEVNLKQVTDGHSPPTFMEQSTRLGSLSPSASLEKPFRDLSRIATQNTGGLASSTGSFTGKSLPVSPGLSSYSRFQETTEMTKVLQSKSGLWDLQRASHPTSGEQFVFPKDSDVSSFSTLSYAQDSGYQNQKPIMGAANIHASNVTGSVGGKPFHVHGIGGTLPAVNFVSRSVQSGEKQTSVAGNVEQLSIRSSQLSSHERTMAGKSSLHKLHPSNEHHGTSSMQSSSDSNLTRQFGNINDMTKELDQLLRSIEEDGGFKDACTRLLRISVEELEKGMDTLSQRCKMWMSQVDEHLNEVHYLLDKTIQVVARKIYMEEIFKQASDSRYWDLWNRQKLNSELELKRHHILSLNQDLTNQLIELERHFNALELNKFSEYGGTHVGQGAFQSRYGPSRYIQSVYSLHNAMSSQLVAAENLSERLSKQMAALSVKSQLEEQQNVKKELFETIGIPYEASFASPDVKGVMKTPSCRNLLLSDSSTNKDKSRRNQASAIKSCEAELSRRRRDSLDQSWTCFEPPKTTVKRMLLQDVQKPNLSRSFFSVNKENASLSMLEKSAPPQTYSRITSTVSPSSGKKAGTVDGRLEEVLEHSKAFTWANDLPASTIFSEFKSPMLQRSNVSAVPSRSASELSPAMVHGQLKETQDLTVEKSNTGIEKFDLITNGETKPVLQMEMPQKSSISTYFTTETPSLLQKSIEMSISNGKMTMIPRSTKENKPSSIVPSESWRIHDLPFSASSNTISVTSTLIEKDNQFNVDKSQPGEKASEVPTLGGSSESASSLTIKTPSASPLVSSVTSAEVPSVAVSVGLSRSLTSLSSSKDARQIMSTSSATVSASPVVSSLTSLSIQGTKRTGPSFTYASPSNSTLDALKSEAQPDAISDLKADSDAAKKAGLPLVEPPGETKLKLEASGKWSPSSSSDDTSSAPAPGPKLAPNGASASQPEPPTDAPMQLSTSFPASSIATSGKNEGLDVGITDEDDMEEEAPEISSSTTELSLGTLGGFGIGSMPNSSTPKPNPFGVSFSNTATSLTSSTSTFSVPSGELFRPASFTFSSPQSSAPGQSTNLLAFSGGFSTGTAVSVPTQSVFGQPAQIGSGQQALGSVLGTFGQSRQLGSGLPGSGFAAPSGFGGGFAGSSPTGGFSSATPGGGFAGIGSTGGGFAGVGSTGGGFAGIASSVGGFGATASTGSGFAAVPSAGSGFAAVPPPGGFAVAAPGGGFGAFSSQGSGGFSAYSSGGVTSKPPELFTQMRK